MIDSHAHAVTGGPGPLDLSEVSLELAETEAARAERARAGPSRLSQELLRVRLARELGCQPDELEEARAEASRDWQAYVRRLFSSGGLEGLVLDPGWSGGDPEEARSEMARLTGAEVRTIMRLDPLVDELIANGATAAEVMEQAQAAVASAPSQGYVGLKTILAYRTGLRVDPGATMAQAQASLDESSPRVPPRRRGKALRDRLTRAMLGWAAELGLPVQFHTGFGDSEIRLSDADPLLLEELLLTSEGRAAQVVLIHGSFPWHEQLAYLALVHPNVHAELSLFNIFAPARLAQRLERVLELAPGSRVLCGTDGHGAPETFWFAATLLQEAWAVLRGRWAQQGARPQWLEGVGQAIFQGNTARLYRFGTPPT